MHAAFERTHLLSWFVTLQPAEEDGELIIYGLRGTDPDPPMLPTRFLDISVLENDFNRNAVQMGAGDMIIFDSGRHVHRVSSVQGRASRLTFGGFMSTDEAKTQVVYWS